MADPGVDIDGLDATRRVFELFQQRIDTWTRVAPRLHDWTIRRQIDLFRSQGRSEGVAWAGYQAEPKYKAFKQAVLGDLTVLRWKGGKSERLYPSLVDKRNSEHVYQVGSNAVVVGTKVPYADRLQRGGKNQFGESAPGRPIAIMGDRSRAKLAQLLAVYIARGEARGNQWER